MLCFLYAKELQVVYFSKFREKNMECPSTFQYSITQLLFMVIEIYNTRKRRFIHGKKLSSGNKDDQLRLPIYYGLCFLPKKRKYRERKNAMILQQLFSIAVASVFTYV